MKPTLPDGLPEKVLECIQLYTTPEVRALKKNIASYCGLKYNSNTDRQIRDAVSELRKQGHPICSDSGKAGYYFSRHAVNQTIAELTARGTDLLETARALERGREVGQMELAL